MAGAEMRSRCNVSVSKVLPNGIIGPRNTSELVQEKFNSIMHLITISQTGK
jgi:hypothetical protein